MATLTKRNYCFPSDKPATKAELNDYFHELANYRGKKETFEEHFKDMDLWIKSL
ncbi:MAG: hypothetical protein LBS50_06745 [Prevotellaceae bacterium]|jgi:hypothetical protein|nr:hypothetical protein [Prevotellaceae bacterium]